MIQRARNVLYNGRGRALALQRRVQSSVYALRNEVPPLESVIIGVGAQKAGTTWLSKALRGHPGVYMREKEVHYWDVVRYPYIGWDDMNRAYSLNGASSPFGQDLLDHSAYLESLTFGRMSERIVAEITPSYSLCTAETYRQMNAIHPNVKFIFLMRDPVDRLWSGIRHKLRRTLARNPDFDGLQRLFVEACSNPHDPDFRRSRYDETLRSLREAGCNVKVMFFETLFSQSSLDEVAEFVGVERLPGRPDLKSNEGKAHTEKLSQETAAFGRERLAEVYDFIFAEYGDAVPGKWRRS